MTAFNDDDVPEHPCDSRWLRLYQGSLLLSYLTSSPERTDVAMHPHLHTKDNIGCKEVMIAFEECHAKGFIWKSMGMCNDAKRALSRCLRAERMKRLYANQDKAEDKNARVRALWKDIDENS